MKDRSINLLNRLLAFEIVFGTLLVVIFAYRPTHFLTYCMAIPMVFVPFAFKKTIFKLDQHDKLIYYVFIFFAYFLGSVVNLYNTTWWYDVVMHFVSGFIVGYFGIFILRKLKLYNCNNRLFNFIYCLFFAIGAAGIWEIAEFVIDCVTGSNLQHSLDTGVVDTMQDLLCGTVSGFIFALIVAFQDKSKK